MARILHYRRSTWNLVPPVLEAQSRLHGGDCVVLDERLLLDLLRWRVIGRGWRGLRCSGLRKRGDDDSLPLDHDVVERLALKNLSNRVVEAEVRKT